MRAGLPIPGEAPLLKTRVHLHRGTAEALWKQLLLVDWQPAEDAWGHNAELLKMRRQRKRPGMGTMRSSLIRYELSEKYIFYFFSDF